LQGRPGYLTGASRLSFIVETGPEVLNRICEDAVVAGNCVQHRFVDCNRELGSRFGTQATELLIAVRLVLRDLFEKEAEVVLIP
jgi:hypothetical protein